MDGRVKRITAASLMLCTLAACTQPEQASDAEPAGLQSLASQHGLSWGSAIGARSLDEPALRALLLRNVGSLTPENALKWDATEPAPGQFQLDAMEQLVAFCKRHRLVLRGHALVWHQQVPIWLEGLQGPQLRAALERHIRTLVGHRRGQIQSWDVINEPIDPEGHGLRRSFWLARLGRGFIADALHWAREADPATQLLINEYGLEGDDPQTARKRLTMLALIDELKRAGAPLDGIGLQAHLLAPATGSPTFRTLPAFLGELRRRGLQVEITELDVSDRLLSAAIDLRDQRVAATYDAFLKAVLTEPALRRITTWGLSDRTTWLNSSFPRPDGRPQRPLPFDNALRAKPAHISIQKDLQTITSPR